MNLSHKPEPCFVSLSTSRSARRILQMRYASNQSVGHTSTIEVGSAENAVSVGTVLNTVEFDLTQRNVHSLFQLWGNCTMGYWSYHGTSRSSLLSAPNCWQIAGECCVTAQWIWQENIADLIFVHQATRHIAFAPTLFSFFSWKPENVRLKRRVITVSMYNTFTSPVHASIANGRHHNHRTTVIM